MSDNQNADANKANIPNSDENGLLKLKHKGENSNQDNNTVNTTQNETIANNIEAPLDQGDSIDFVNDTYLYQKRKQDMEGQGDYKDPDFDHSIDKKDKD